MSRPMDFPSTPPAPHLVRYYDNAANALKPYIDWKAESCRNKVDPHIPDVSAWHRLALPIYLPYVLAYMYASLVISLRSCQSNNVRSFANDLSVRVANSHSDRLDRSAFSSEAHERMAYGEYEQNNSI